MTPSLPHVCRHFVYPKNCTAWPGRVLRVHIFFAEHGKKRHVLASILGIQVHQSAEKNLHVNFSAKKRTVSLCHNRHRLFSYSMPPAKSWHFNVPLGREWPLKRVVFCRAKLKKCELLAPSPAFKPCTAMPGNPSRHQKRQKKPALKYVNFTANNCLKPIIGTLVVKISRHPHVVGLFLEEPKEGFWVILTKNPLGNGCVFYLRFFLLNTLPKIKSNGRRRQMFFFLLLSHLLVAPRRKEGAEMILFFSFLPFLLPQHFFFFLFLFAPLLTLAFLSPFLSSSANLLFRGKRWREKKVAESVSLCFSLFLLPLLFSPPEKDWSRVSLPPSPSLPPPSLFLTPCMLSLSTFYVPCILIFLLQIKRVLEKAMLWKCFMRNSKMITRISITRKYLNLDQGAAASKFTRAPFIFVFIPLSIFLC